MATATTLRSWMTLARPSSVVASVALHVGAIAAGGHAFGTARDGALGAETTPRAVEVDLDLSRPALLDEPRSADDTAPPARPAVATHRHSYPVSPNHDARPHDPSIVHLPLPLGVASVPSVVAGAAESPVHFVLTGGGAVVNGLGAAASAHGAEGTAGEAPTAFDGADVSDPARLRASVPVVYPAEARRAQVEADVLVEIILDARGHVIEARPVSSAGYGLEVEALRAVRAYRFSPALRGGHAVPVRMRWTVSFRLR